MPSVQAAKAAKAATVEMEWSQIEYTIHAREQMAERGISQDEVEHCLSNEDTEYEGRGGVRVLLGPDGKGRRIKLCIVPLGEGRFLLVTTAVWEE